ncbi:hypothetical protein SAMN02745245_01081 [Anaerosphaera aminiphila DSM 21120]|uniref:Uncharacterized protein n=1 Tax=Anaerosphaera aminiphila DSM 21120 TaxID=1120995 RepID=A0A1M5S1G6_9FIRM|nr:hypothetical protein [Anaerosphaera aminiphila]SHH32326.1 hypothetical protein SAMN02745245_01081 [Anaerosphaera aminiphila DSM 21120]
MKEKFYRFMQGRYGAHYGMDALSKFLFGLMFVLVLATIFLGNNVISNVGLILLIVVLYYRLFSKNVTARYQENQKFLNITAPVRKFFTRTKRNVKERKEYKYIQCENCKQELRVPRKKGKIKVTCKKCGHQFEVRT